MPRMTKGLEKIRELMSVIMKNGRQMAILRLLNGKMS